MDTLKNWKTQTDTDNIVWLTLQYAEGSANVLSDEVMNELATLILAYEKNIPQGIIIQSGYKNGFIAGADINEFLSLKTAEQALAKMRKGQEIFQKLANLSCPTVALINGFCLGGGLELALACRYRIALDENSTRLGFPEILLGIHPGWGGCVRLPLLIGAPAALNLIMSGRAVDAKTAKKLGIVDAVVPLREFTRAARYYILHRMPVHRLRGWRAFSNADRIRPLLAYFIRYQLRQKVNPAHYPAPFAVLDWWLNTGPQATDAFSKEAESVSQLITQPSTANLIRVYFLQQRLKKFAAYQEHPPRHIHVVGSGTMGGDIAAWCALQGFQVTLSDKQLSMLARAYGRAAALFSKRLTKKTDQQRALDRFVIDADAIGLRNADIIIEAIPEDLALKQTVWREIEKQAKPTALLATNTSSIPLAAIGESLQQPERLIGIHFFNPVSALQLVEVVTLKNTDPELSQRAYQFLKMIHHFPLPVQSAPGFLVNRVLIPYLIEAAMMLDEGVPAHMIDAAAKEFGMPIGPVEVADMVGLDVCLAVTEHLAPYYGLTVPNILRSKVAAGQLGKKTGNGFYEYSYGKLHDARLNASNEMTWDSALITDRMILRLLNEACACWREKIVADADLVDAGMIFGSGFAPFRGGPLHYARHLGINKLLEKFNHLETQYGDRFKVDSGWKEFFYQHKS